jgi:hypothetical protein
MRTAPRGGGANSCRGARRHGARPCLVSSGILLRCQLAEQTVLLHDEAGGEVQRLRTRGQAAAEDQGP